METKEKELLDIQDERIKKNCFACGKPQDKYQKLLQVIVDEKEASITRTKNFSGVCKNPDCFRYTDMKKVKTWVLASAIL